MRLIRRIHINQKENKIKKYTNFKILLLLLLIFLFFFKEIIKFNLKEDFKNHLKKIELEDAIFEKEYLTIELIENKIEEINLKNKMNKIINESNVPNISNINLKYNSISPNYYRLESFTINNISNCYICKEPKISIIIPIYNSQEELLSLHKSIQDQSLKTIEIIYIDNNSTDNSSQIIQNLQKRDKRIILLKNKGNKGPFYSRNKGVLFAKGEYIQFIDSDDAIFGNILEKSYLIAKFRNLDIIQYRAYIQINNKYLIFDEAIKKNEIMIQPELSDHMYYGQGKLMQTNFYIFNKIIKRKIFLKALIYMGVELLNEHLFFNEDLLQLFCILRVANSFLFINDIGYLKLKKIKEVKSLIDNFNNPKYANKILHDNFIEVKFIFNKTDNNKHDKAISCQFLRMTENLYSNIFKNVTQGFELFKEVFNQFLNSEYLSTSQKIELEQLRRNILRNH